jgi:TPR repeat protein
MRAALGALAALLSAAAPAAADMGLRCIAEAESGNHRLCEQAVRAAPNDLRVRRAFARALLIGGAENRAVLEYDEVARRAPNDPQAHFDLAATLGALNYYEDAERPLERALALKPDYEDAHRLAVLMNERLRRWERALRHSLRLAESGDTAAMHDVSLAYELGRGAPQSHATALLWLERAGEGGHVGALDRLTNIYLEGLLGVAADERAALAWAANARRARLRPD